MIASPASLRSVYPLCNPVPQCFREHAGMFEEAVDGRITRKSLKERQTGLRVLLAGLEEWLEQHQVRHHVDERVPREVLSGPPVLELAFVAREDRGREILPGVGLVGPGGGQAARLERVTEALPAWRPPARWPVADVRESDRRSL